MYTQAYDGLSSFLYKLGAAKIRFAIFTSGTPHHIIRNIQTSLPEINLQNENNKVLSDTNKLRAFEERLASHFNLPSFTIVTADDTTKHKPEPDGILLAIKRLGASPYSVAVMGDHKVDMQAAIKAGVATRIGITHGFDDETALRQHRATHVVNHLFEAMEVIQGAT